jgi:SagB-type dehydrogenase family enzyme
MGLFGRRTDPPSPPRPPVDDLTRVIAYHERTKHDYGRYAIGPGDMDWKTQPDPFRRFVGADLVTLERPEPLDQPLYEPAFCEGEVASAPLTRAGLAQLLFDSLALSAWKRFGASHWSLRVNPSSGNLHPTEGYVIAGPLRGISDDAFVAHYAAKEHALELRARVPAATWTELSRGLPEGGFFVGLTSIHWRESWKYGERAFRYCQHDTGHAIGALAVAAAALGWRARVVDEPSSAELAALFGVASQRGPEAERAETLIAIAPQSARLGDAAPSERALALCSKLEWSGRPNDLSSAQVDWDVIDAVEEATLKPRMAVGSEPLGVPRAPAWEPAREPISLRRIVRQRRSAVALDRRTGMTRDAFFQTLRRTLVGDKRFVLDALPWDPSIDLVLFVHRVEGVEPGLYVLLRDPRREQRLRAATKRDFSWRRIDEGDTSIFELRLGDVRSLARSVACNQDIAADGCFAVAMLADFRGALAHHGPWFYRRLFWECGFVGQLLYLESEALGLHATGIGCFFDNPVHHALGLTSNGLSSNEFQSLYHFTLGGAVDDPRITSEPAYPGE